MLMHSPVSLLKGVRSRFIRTFNETRTDLLMLATMLSSDSDVETYAWIDELPRMREFLTERRITGLGDARYDVANRKFESTIGVKRDHLSDSKIDMINMRISELAKEAKGHPMTLLAEQLVNGVSASVTDSESGAIRSNVCYDGEAFFSATHPARGVLTATQSNLSAGTGTSVAQLSADLAAVKTVMSRRLDAGGKPFRRQWVQIAIVAPPDLEQNFKTVLESDLISNTTNVQKGQAQLVIMPELTDINDWYVLHVGGELKPLGFQLREPVEFASQDDPESNESAFMREVYTYGTRYRGAALYGLWQDAHKVTN